MKKVLAAVAVLAISASSAFAADWEPDGPIRLWIGYGAGGGTDVQARMLAKELEATRGWVLVPENGLHRVGRHLMTSRPQRMQVSSLYGPTGARRSRPVQKLSPVILASLSITCGPQAVKAP